MYAYLYLYYQSDVLTHLQHAVVKVLDVSQMELRWGWSKTTSLSLAFKEPVIIENELYEAENWTRKISLFHTA